MKKFIIDFLVKENNNLNSNYSLLKLTPKQGTLPVIYPGQFVQVLINNSPSTYLRRPISVNYVDYCQNELWLLIRNAGAGTNALIDTKIGEILNIILPLGNSFSYPKSKDDEVLLIGGGVGVAPLLYWGSILKQQGYKPSFLLGAKSASDLLELDYFRQFGSVYVSTDDGTMGEKGFVINNTILQTGTFKQISCCGPAIMMKAIAKIARHKGVECEVSLENTMACGVGACLCCVEDTVNGNVCVCKDGPIFNIDKLKWEI
ncbi:MAG: dihydroorotate dehydrogenase electron transfer subunit [Muribaculaceae bacterium]